MSGDDAKWTLQHRVEAWNLIYETARYFQREIQSDQFSLSPFVATSFLHLARLYTAPATAGAPARHSRRDLFLMTLSAVFITIKAESIKKCQLTTLVNGFVRVVCGFSRESKDVLGPSSTVLDRPRRGRAGAAARLSPIHRDRAGGGARLFEWN
jgi:hypothetical protein